jgi:outer membrane protein OmpA-like peptidoglycan-associated protein
VASALTNLVVLAVLAVWWLGRSGEDETGAGADSNQQVVTPSDEAAGSTADGGSAEAPEPSGPGTSAPATTVAFTMPVTPDNPEGAPQYAVFTGGTVYLRGFYPSREIADHALTAAIAVIGQGFVVDEMQIDPAAPVDANYFPVYIQDYVLFEFGSADLAPDFIPILDLALIFLSQNPQATLTVVARTDAVGTPEFNVELSRQRAQAVIDYWLGNGISPNQVIADPRGEEGATPEADEQTAAFDRRVEMIVSGLLSG